MEEKNLEQSEVSDAVDNSDVNPHSENDDSERGVPAKFISVACLVKAYESLQAEYTRKSQKLKELEGEPSRASVAEEKVRVQEGVCARPEIPPVGRNDNEAIKDYLLSLAAREKAVTVIDSGRNDFCTGAIREAKSINATTKVAENFFANKSLRRD